MKPSVKSTIKHDKAQIDKGLVKVHPWVPKNKAGEVLEYCKSLREAHKQQGESDDNSNNR